MVKIFNIISLWDCYEQNNNQQNEVPITQYGFFFHTLPFQCWYRKLNEIVMPLVATQVYLQLVCFLFRQR